jgi:hypothetical protein
MKSLWQNRNFRKNVLVLALFLALVHLFYWRTRQAGFVADFTGLLHRLDGASFSGVWTCFGFPAMHQVTNFFLFFFVKWFGEGGIGWHLVFTSLHVANAFLGFLLVKKIFEKSSHSNPFTPALMASLLFLLSPYQAEAVVWRVCFNFLFCTLLMLGSLLLLVKYFEGKKSVHLLCSHGLFVLALFTFELALALPLLAFLLAVVWPLTPKGGPMRPFLLNSFLRRSPKSVEPKIDSPTPVRTAEVENHGSSGRIGSPSGVRGKSWVAVFLPHLFLVIAYFLLNKLLLGGWAGHYGEAVHLNFDLRNIASNCLKYFTKYLFFWREWPHWSKEWLVLFFEKPVVAWSGLAVGLLGVVWLVKTSLYQKACRVCGRPIYWADRLNLFAKTKICGECFIGQRNKLGDHKEHLPPDLAMLDAKKMHLLGIGWLLFFLALAPVANLYVAYILHGENDRYGYLPSLFFFMGLMAVFDFFPRLLRNLLFGTWLLASVFFLQRMTSHWQQSAKITTSLLNDFRWQNASEVYVLAMPENYHGVPMFKDFSRENLALKHALRYLADKPSDADFYQIAQFNMTTPTDGFTAKRDSATGVFHLQFNQWGNWWWLYGMGLGDYQTGQYRFRTDGNGCRVEMKQWPAKQGSVFIVAQGGRWEEI